MCVHYLSTYMGDAWPRLRYLLADRRALVISVGLFVGVVPVSSDRGGLILEQVGLLREVDGDPSRLIFALALL